MIRKMNVIETPNFEATYKSGHRIKSEVVFERITSVNDESNSKYYQIEKFVSGDNSHPVKKYGVAISKEGNIQSLEIDIYKNKNIFKHAEFEFKKNRILFNDYEIEHSGKSNDDCKKTLIKQTEIDMLDEYICFPDTISFRNLIATKFPNTGIKRCDGFFIDTKNNEISYKITDCELHFDDEEEIEIGLGKFVCKKRRALYSLSSKLTMETLYTDNENILISVAKILESPTGNNKTEEYNIVERTENIHKLPKEIVFHESLEKAAKLDKIKMGKYQYFDENNNKIAIEKWVRNELNKHQVYRSHELYNNDEKAIMDIRLKKTQNPANKYSEIKVYREFQPFTKQKETGKFWFYSNKVVSNTMSDKKESKNSSYSSEGYYVFYPMSGLTDIIIENRELPMLDEAKSCCVRFFRTSIYSIVRPRVVSQLIKYECDEYVEVMHRKFYAMKIIITDDEYTNVLWFDKDHLLNLKWQLIDSNKKTIFKSELVELNV